MTHSVCANEEAGHCTLHVSYDSILRLMLKVILELNQCVQEVLNMRFVLELVPFIIRVCVSECLELGDHISYCVTGTQSMQ